MNDSPIIKAPEPRPGATWLDAYMPDGPVGQFQGTGTWVNMAFVRGVLFRQRWLFAAVISFALVVGLVVSLLATPMFRAETKVRVSPSRSYIVDGQDIEGGLASNQVFDYLATQAQIISSSAVASIVAKDLKLGSRYDVLGKDIDEQRPKGMTDAKWQERKTEIAASYIKGMVTAQVPRSSWVITISVNSANPTLAAELANGFADAYLTFDSRSSLENNRYAREYLRTQIDALKVKLQEAELAANAYARENSIITGISGRGDANSRSTLTTENLTDINVRVATAKAARIEAEQRWRSIQNAPAGQFPESQANAALQNLLAQRSLRQAELAQLRLRYDDQFPQIRSLIVQIEELDSQIQRTGADIKAIVRNAYIIAQNQEDALERELNSVTSEKVSEQDRQVQFAALEREAAALTNQLNALLNRYNELNSAAEIESTSVAKLDPAEVPSRPYSPNTPLNLTIALIFGIAAASALAVIREALDDRIRSLDDIEAKIGLPLIGHTPFVDDRDIETAGNDRFSALMEAYSSIRASIDFSQPRSRNVIQFTSSQASEGKSTTALLLAELFANSGRSTLLIDADLRRPSVAGLLGRERPKVGVPEVVLGHVSIEEAIIKGAHPNLDILPTGEIPPNPVDLLASPEFRDFIEAQRKAYSLVIIDSCPVMGLADAPIVANIVDSTIFVLEANKVPFGNVRSALRRITASGGNLIGLIVTKYRALEAGQDYNYQYAYYKYGDDK